MLNQLKVLQKVPVWVYVLGAVGVALWVSKKGVQGAAADVTGGVIKGAADGVVGVGVGAVKGVGSVFGIPDTDINQCKACIRRGDDYGASKYCTASQFARWQYLSVRQNIFGTPFTVDDVFN